MAGRAQGERVGPGLSGIVEAATKIAWLALAVIHLPPAAVLVAPGLAERLYAVDPTGAPGVLIVHRGALFLGLVILALWAMLDPALRLAASTVLIVSVVGFLVVYARTAPNELRAIAVADTIALAPLLWVAWRAWAA